MRLNLLVAQIRCSPAMSAAHQASGQSSSSALPIKPHALVAALPSLRVGHDER
jgi:hypothetical protein